MAKRQTIPVSKRALVARINRKLKDDGQTLKFTRGERATLDLGDVYLWDVRRRLALDTFVDVEEFGRDLGVLREWESLYEDKES
jgi:hypothetical protein